jgi:predicted RNA-binding protein YlxR (DUF448 family)
MDRIPGAGAAGVGAAEPPGDTVTAAPGSRQPVRTCVGCGERTGPAALVRLSVLGGRVTVDRERRGGRGAWLHAREDCLLAAVKRRSITRALRRPEAELDVPALRAGLTGNACRD